MIGQRLSDRYEITGELGRGGMGVVYRARDPLLNRDVAIKLIPPSLLSTDGEQRFQREAQVVAQMDHPAIVSVHDFGRHESALFFVMPLVQGSNLHAFLKTAALLGDVLDVGIQVAEALEYSHRRGVIHRDIKPDNIMVSHEGGGVRTRVMDFGLARAATEARLTKSGAMVGTLYYLSPEQVMARELDGRSDIYSLGTVLYECVMGSPPFTGDTQAVLYRIAHEVPQSPRSLGAEIDEELEQIILACLAKDPGRRPQTAGELAEALRRYRSRLRESERSRALTSLTRTHQTLRPVLQPFVGRAKEFAELQQRLNAAVAGECQFVLVAGEAGIGKTRLLEELGNLAGARKIRVLHGRTADQDRAFPYQGFCDLIQEFFRQREDASAPPPDLSDLASDLVALFPMLNEISEIREAATGGAAPARPGAVGADDRTQVFELLARTLTRVAGGRPLVLMLEDLHAAEVSIEALQYIFRRLGPTPTLMVGTYRSTEVGERHPLLRVLDGFRGDRRFSAISLGPFSASDHRQLLETIVGGSQLSDGLVHRIFDATKGNPFFTKELVRSLLDAGGISKDDTGEWNLSGEAGIGSDALPATIQQAVEKRIERLPDEVREILAVASVVGRTFDARDIEALADGKEDIDDAVDVLLREGLIEEERESRGDLLAFSSGVVRDVLYAGLSRRKRRGLHRRYAELLETRHAGRRERVLPQLVHHYFQGDVADKAVEYGLRLARTSLESWSAEEAVRSAKMALEFLDDEWDGDRALEGEARMLLARAHRMAGNIDATLKEADAAVRVFERVGRGEIAVSALLLGAEAAWQARRSEETSRWVDRGLLAARAAGDTESLRQLLSLAATLANLMGEYAKASARAEEAARLAPEAKEAVAPEAIRPGGRLVVALANDAGAIEPTAIETTEELEISANVYEALLATDVHGNVVPNLCEKWEASEGGRVFLLTLRRDVRFSDGTPVTAEDVRASFEICIRQAGREMPPAYAAIEGTAELRAGQPDAALGVSVRGPDKIEIRLKEPLAIYPALLTAGTGVARSVAVDGAPAGLLGTGPFRLASQDRQSIVLERNPQYWRGAPTPLDAVEFRTYPSATAIATAFRAGEIDVARDLLPADLEEILRDAQLRRGLVEAAKRNTYMVLLNTRCGPLARHAAVRRALVGVVRTSDLVWSTLGRFAQPAVCLIPPGMLGHDPGRRARLLAFEEARELLKGADVAPPQRLRISVQPLFQDRYGALLNALLPLWSDLGLEVDIATTDMAGYLATWEQNESVDLLIGRWNADYDDPDNFAHTLFHSHGGLWRSWFCSADADRLIEEARAESRPAVREGLYRKFEALLQDTAALVPLFHDLDYRLVGPRVRGLTLRGTVPFVNYPQIGKEEALVPEAEPIRASGGVLHVPIAGLVSTLDPARADLVENAEVTPSIFESLTRDAGGARFVPWLAVEFSAEEGGRRYRFRLREDVRFQDGRRLSARDVRYSLERMMQQPRNDVRWTYSLIKGAQALLNGDARDLAGLRIESASELTIELEEPAAYFPALMAHPAAGIVPEGSDPGVPEGWVGTGPYRVVAFEPGRRLELERNRQYWRKGYPRNEGLVFHFGAPPKEVLAGFRAGRFSLASGLFPGDVETLRREADFASGYSETPGLLTYYLALNAHAGPLADLGLRQRLVGAVDAARLVRQTLGRLALPAVSLIPPGLLGHGPTQSRSEAASVARGDAMNSLELTAAVHPLFFAGYAAFARELEAVLSPLGIRLRVANKTMEEMVEAQRLASVDVNLARWVADYPDADTFVRTVHTREGHLGPLCGSPELDNLIARGRTETVPAIRHGIYREVEELLAREARLLPLFHEQVYRFTRPEVEGLTLSFGWPAVSYENLRIRG